MKILLLTLHYPSKKNPYSGSFNISRVKALQQKGANVKVVNIVNPFPPISDVFPFPKFSRLWKYVLLNTRANNRFNYNTISLSWIPFPKKINWFYQLPMLNFFIGNRFKKIVKSFLPDLIICSEIHPYGTYAKYIKKYYQCPVFVISEGSDLLRMPDEYKGFDKILSSLNKYSDKVIFLSDFQKQFVLKKHKIDNSIIINNGIESDLFKFSYATRNVDISHSNPFRILSVGNLYFVKGHDILLKAIKNLDIDFHLTIIGNGYKKIEYEKFIQENNLSEKVTIHSPVPQNELINFMNNSDIFCIPSRAEGFCIAGLEAMAAGLPVIATNVGIFPEVITEGFNGFIVNIEKPIEMKDAIIKASSINWKHQQISDFTRKNYSWNKWAENILWLYYKKSKMDLHLKCSSIKENQFFLN